MSQKKYENFDLLIETASNAYRARVLGSPAGEGAKVTFTLPFSEEDLRAFLGLSGRTLRSLVLIAPAQGKTEQLDPQRFGERLFDAAFAADVGICLIRSLDETRRQGVGLRIRLRLDEGVPELADLPWEYLYARPLNRFVAVSDQTVLLRYTELPLRQQALQVSPPLHVLTVISDPTDTPRLDVEAEWAHLQEALADLQASRLLQVERLEPATLAMLQSRLRQGDIHILHFIGHGYFDPESNEGGLIFESDDRHSREVNVGRLGVLLHDHESLRLIFLNACEGARGGYTDSFAGTAQRLVQQGIPAVLAMQFKVSDQAAITLSHAFYSAMADGYPVDTALAEARKAVYTGGDDLEWGTPVLYLRAPDGRIFDIEVVEEPESRIAVTHSHGSKPDTLGMGTSAATQSKEGGMRERPKRQSGGVRIGNITGGIHSSIIAGRDVSNSTITLGGPSTPADKEPSLDELKQLLAEIQAELAGITAQKEALQTVSTAALFTAQGAQASVQQAADQLKAEIEKEQAASVQHCLIEATNLLSGILDGAKTVAEKAGEVSQVVKPLAEMLASLVEKLGVAAIWIARLWLQS
jgi:hypothetical protein